MLCRDARAVQRGEDSAWPGPAEGPSAQKRRLPFARLPPIRYSHSFPHGALVLLLIKRATPARGHHIHDSTHAMFSFQLAR